MKKILLVEDDPFLSLLLKNRLAKESYEVMHAHDGEEALELLGMNSFDLILLDIILPKKNGFETLEAIRQSPIFSSVRVIILSNLGQESDLARGKSLGIIDYWIKTENSIDTLMAKIRNILL
ncbi:MAG: response regulator [Candidatus Harrisonbacteria bacterium]|nr:response regulator [Candidatus Harrisonbacteria bacterium]